MSPLALTLGLLLGAAPTEKIVVLPFEPLGISPERASSAERAVRASLGGLPRVELVDPAAVRLLLAAEADLRGCAETGCLASVAQKLGAHSVVSGVVGGLGAFRSLVVKRTDCEGRVVTSVSEAIAEDDARLPDLVCAVLARPAGCAEEASSAALGLALPPPPQVVSEQDRPMRATRKAALGVGAGALASFGAALGFGLSSRSIAGQIERVDSSCDAACLERRLATGRMHAVLSDVFWGMGGALAAAGVILFVLPEPAAPGVSLGPGPTALGLSAHARF